jgi:formylglycine-generating enzyme required for sulfatase activity
MVFVPGGVYPLGTEDFFAESGERPRIYVYTGSFFIDTYEVTNERYGKFLRWSRQGEDPSRFRHPLEAVQFPDGKDRTPAFWDDARFNQPDQPVVGVDWFDAWAYARWAGKSLPTEAQWEIAASCDPRTNKKLKYPWGEEKPVLSRAVWDARRTFPVGEREFGASPFGARDMAGNAAEWCLDAFRKDRWSRFRKTELMTGDWAVFKPLRFARKGGDTDGDALPFDPDSAEWTVRGGSWDGNEEALRTVARRGESGRSNKIGFRCVFVPRAQEAGR